MHDLGLLPELAPLLGLWLAATLLAAARLLRGRPIGSWVWPSLLLFAPVLAVALGLPARSGAPTAALGLIYLNGVALVHLGPRVWTILSARGFQAALLMLIPVAASVWFLAQAHADEVMPAEWAYEMAPPRPTAELADTPAYTDRGHLIPLYVHRCESFSPDAVIAAENSAAQRYPLAATRTGPASYLCNCHGWVFTGGRFWIHSDDVDTILNDNGYTPVSDPRPGDVIVYRNARGWPTHTGLVELVRDDLILIESKWGNLGRFLHAPADQPFPGELTYYRSERDGHNIQIDFSASRSDSAP